MGARLWRSAGVAGRGCGGARECVAECRWRSAKVAVMGRMWRMRVMAECGSAGVKGCGSAEWLSAGANGKWVALAPPRGPAACSPGRLSPTRSPADRLSTDLARLICPSCPAVRVSVEVRAGWSSSSPVRLIRPSCRAARVPVGGRAGRPNSSPRGRFVRRVMPAEAPSAAVRAVITAPPGGAVAGSLSGGADLRCCSVVCPMLADWLVLLGGVLVGAGVPSP